MIKFLLKKTPIEKIRYFEKHGFKIPADWRELYKEAEELSHKAADLLKLEILDKTEDAISKAINNGETLQQFTNRLKPQFQKLGLWQEKVELNTGKVITVASSWRLRLIHWAHTQQALQSARMKVQFSNSKNRPYGQYICMMNENSRESHMALNGQVRPLEEWILSGLYPPNGWNCHCRIRTLSEKDLQRKNLQVETESPEIEPDEGWSGKPENDYKPDLTKYNLLFVEQYQKALKEWKR